MKKMRSLEDVVQLIADRIRNVLDLVFDITSRIFNDIPGSSKFIVDAELLNAAIANSRLKV
jgi:hypothetical protein